jgi:hypothetical protein
MTAEKRAAVISKAPGAWKDFLALPNRSRAARLVGPPRLPKPLAAAVKDGYLSWTWYSDDLGGRNVAPARQKLPMKLCFDFMRLAGGSEEEIRLFAKKWGPLGLEKREQELVASWRGYARLAQALIRFAGQRAMEGPGEDEDWQVIVKSIPAPPIERKGMDPAAQLAILAAAVNTWFAQARGHAIMTMADGSLQIQPSASNLFGVLITQIAHVIARSDQTAMCAGCRYPFTPKRPIVRGVRQYCNGCRKAKVPQRDAARDWRRRVRREQHAMPC